MALIYEVARNQIKDGDLIAVITPHSFLGHLTKFFTRKKYVHTGTAIWMSSDMLCIAELNGGRNHFTPLSQLEGLDFDVFAMPAGLSGIAAAIVKWVRTPVEYGYLAFIVIGLRNFFRIKQQINWRQILVCSGLSVAIYEEAGWPRCSRVISPGELADMLQLKFEVRKN